MKKEGDLIKVFTGTEGNSLLLKGKLEAAGVASIIKNDSESAFLGSAPPVVDLYIEYSDLAGVQQMLKDFLSTNKVK
jgi:hypothetical protein